MTQTARIYGDSMYELAAEENLTEQILEQMQDVRGIFRSNPDYLRLLSEPAIPEKTRTGLIEEAFGPQAERYLVSFLKLLCEKGALGDFGGCCEEFRRRYNEDHGIAEAVVTSAVPLTEQQTAKLKEKLASISGKKIELIIKTDPGVIAGIKVELDGKELDGTVNGRLSGISRTLKERQI